jgi:U3 small nucleolar ribonucleoprotein protein IMP3
MSLRKLKYHEAKLLKKVDFLEWKKEQSIREIAVLRRYHIQDRADYVKSPCLLIFIASNASI